MTFISTRMNILFINLGTFVENKQLFAISQLVQSVNQLKRVAGVISGLQCKSTEILYTV